LGIRSSSKTGSTHHLACGWPCQRPHGTLKRPGRGCSGASTLPRGVARSSENARPPAAQDLEQPTEQTPSVDTRSRTSHLERHSCEETVTHNRLGTATGGPAHLDRRSCWTRIGSSSPADDFRKLSEFGRRLMEVLGRATDPLELFRTRFSDPCGCAITFGAQCRRS
jgi:hypothetical protein